MKINAFKMWQKKLAVQKHYFKLVASMGYSTWMMANRLTSVLALFSASKA